MLADNSSTNATSYDGQLASIEYITSISSTYVIPLLSSIGLLSNFVCVLAFAKLNKPFHKMIALKSTGDMLLCSFGINYKSLKCFGCINESMTSQLLNIVYCYYILGLSYIVINLLTELIDFTFSIDRYRKLANKKSLLNKISSSKLFCLLILLALSASLLDVFAFSVYKTSINNVYTFIVNQFGKSTFYSIYRAVKNILTVVLLFVIAGINIKLFFKYKNIKSLIKKGKVQIFKNKLITKNKFTKMYLVIAGVCLFRYILYILYIVYLIVQGPLKAYLNNFINVLFFVSLLLPRVGNIIVYLIYDKHIRKSLKKLIFTLFKSTKKKKFF